MELSPSPVHDRTIKCLAGFVSLKTATTRSVRSAVEDNDARFRIWAGNLGALQRSSSKASADYRLKEAPEVASRIPEILEDICETHEDLQTALTPGAQPSEDEDEDDEGDVAHDLCLSVGDSITSLLKVSALLRKATTRDRYALAAASKHDTLPQEYGYFDDRHVCEKFPKVLEQPWLRERLSSAITQRRRYLRYAQGHHKRIAKDAFIATIQPSSAPNEALRAILRTADNRSLGNTLTTAGGSTKASTLQIDRVAAMSFTEPDADDDDNVSVATTFITNAPENEGASRANVAKLDGLTKNHEPFECPYCRGVVQFKHQRAWKKHVFRDLRAYVCTFPDCDSGLFEDISAWFAHLLEHHLRVWICLPFSSKTFASEHVFRSHLRTVHGYAEPGIIASISKSSSRPVDSVDPNACSLCHWTEHLKIAPGLADTTSISLSLFKQHLGSHHEQLALFAITPDFERDLNSDQGSHSTGDAGVDREEVSIACI